MKTLLLAVLLSIATATVHADVFEMASGFVNSITDDPITVYAKNVVAEEVDIKPSEFQSFSFTTDVKHRAVLSETGKSYTCSAVTVEDGTEYRMVIRSIEGFTSIMEGEPYYLSLCAPHTAQGKLELQLLELVAKSKALFEEI